MSIFSKVLHPKDTLISSFIGGVFSDIAEGHYGKVLANVYGFLHNNGLKVAFAASLVDAGLTFWATHGCVKCDSVQHWARLVWESSGIASVVVINHNAEPPLLIK